MLKIIFFISGLLIFCWHADAQEIDSQKLVRDALSNGAATYARMKDYAFNSKISLRMFDKKGHAKDTLIYKSPAPLTRKENESGLRGYVLIEKNGKPLSDERVQRQTVNTDRRIDKLEKKQESASSRDPVDPQPNYLKFGNIKFGKNLVLGPSTILSKCVFTAPARTSVAGRKAIQLDFASCSIDGLDKNEVYVAKLVGRVWIDEADKVLSRLEASIPDPKLLNPSSDPQLIYEQTKVDSNWFPKMAMINSSATLLVSLFSSVENIEYKIEFTDYRPFEH